MSVRINLRVWQTGSSEGLWQPLEDRDGGSAAAPLHQETQKGPSIRVELAMENISCIPLLSTWPPVDEAMTQLV